MIRLLKISYLIILSAINSFFFAQTNIYYPFPESGGVWRSSSQGQLPGACACEGLVCQEDREWETIMKGDTIINQKQYHKLYDKGYYADHIAFGFTYTCPPGQPNYEKHYYCLYNGAIRQDSAAKKVYLCRSGESEKLLYDFNLKLGDTLPETAVTYSNSLQVLKVDSFLAGGNFRKKFSIAKLNGNTEVFSLIEGIGSTWGLTAFFYDFEWGSVLRCYTENSVPLYPSYKYICDMIDGIKDQPHFENNIEVGALPEQIIVVKSANPSERQELILFDLLGKKIKAYKVSSFINHLSAEEFPSGIYFFQLTFSGTPIKTGKLLLH